MKNLILLVIPIVLLSACGNSNNSTKQTATSSSSVATNKDHSKTLSGLLTVGKDEDLLPGTYNIKAVGDQYGLIFAQESDETSIFTQYMASPEGLKKYNKQHKDGNPDIYDEDVLGAVLHDGATIKTSGVSLEFTKVD